MLKQLLESLFLEYEIEYNQYMLDNIHIFADYLLLKNKDLNLTRIVSETGMVFHHFLDSALLLKHSKDGFFLDIGSGAGFPGIILAIMKPKSKFVLIDSIGKKTRFLSDVKDLLKLDNVEVINSRVENLNLENTFDYITARAVAKTSVILDYGYPLLKQGGIFLAQKGPKYIDEIDSINLKKFKINVIKKYEVDDHLKYILEFEKISNTRKKI
jgi:16S rRNA (guanine527-N7)-methyltransferase